MTDYDYINLQLLLLLLR